jgi:hypothetical protein
MAAPIAAFIQTPDDSGNTGKKVRTQTQVVGADTVHEHYFVLSSYRRYVGFYSGVVPSYTPPIAAQNGTSTGAFWLFNPVGNANKGAVRRWSSTINFNALAVDLIPGQFRISLFTFTGTASGAQVTLGKNDSAFAAPTINLRTASTGLTVTLGATMWEEQGPILPLATGSGVVCGPYTGIERDPDMEQAEIVLRAGEGLVEWSALGLTTANRRMTTNLGIAEFE